MESTTESLTEAPTYSTTVETTESPTEEAISEVTDEPSNESTAEQSNELTDETTEEAAEAVFAQFDEPSDTTQAQIVEQEPESGSPSIWIFVLIGVCVVCIVAGGVVFMRKKKIKQT